MKKTSLEIKDAKSQLIQRNLAIVELCRTEKRDLTEEEQKEYDENKEKVEELDEEMKSLEEDLKEEPKSEEPEKTEEKNTRNTKMNKSLVKEIRSAMERNEKKILVNAETRTMAVTGENGVHDSVIETEVQGILEPLYANSVLSQLGCRWYTGLPQGDVQVPVMGKGTVGWADEIAAAQKTGNVFTHVKLSPKRLTAYCDISKQLLAQDTIGVENAIRRDIVNALNDKLEATLLGAAAKTDNSPAGLFNGKTLTTVTDYKGVCDLEAAAEEKNISGEKKYLLSPKAKAYFRQLAKSTKHTQLVLEGGELDGTPVITSSNVPANQFIYGNFSDVLIGSWGNIEITVDEYTQAVNGCVRLVINAYFDCVMAERKGKEGEADVNLLAFGTVATA